MARLDEVISTARDENDLVKIRSSWSRPEKLDPEVVKDIKDNILANLIAALADAKANEKTTKIEEIGEQIEMCNIVIRDTKLYRADNPSAAPRTSVNKALSDANKKIAKSMPKPAEHLNKSVRAENYAFCYLPGRPHPEWTL
jgi:hypothetical protein